MIKTKVKPEDFIVEEVAEIPINKTGDFCVYLLWKRGQNTTEVLKKLSKQSGIPLSCFSYGGRKDKYASTSQYITIARNSLRQLPRNHPWSPFKKEETGKIRRPLFTKEEREENHSLEFIGFTDREMGPDLIKGNIFQITVRNLTRADIQYALSEIDRVKQDGYPNYFDDQRFGSFDSRQGFIAEKILKKHYNGALKIYFTRFHPADRKKEKEHKKFLFENWGNWQACIKEAGNTLEKEAFKYLEKNPKGFILVIQRIPPEELLLFFSVYQSHLWNEVLKRIIVTIGKDYLRVCKGIAGDYLFYEHLDDKHIEYLRNLSFPTPASNVRMPDTLTETVYSNVLKDYELKSSFFNIRKIRQAFFKGTERKAVVTPEDLVTDSADDEIYSNKKKLILKFFLPRGSFGTMFIKRLFS
ncbi:MAG: tRNA pseudouridine(13) synthase TruD [wastewater metagenome]|nr:tRNA pseudouridine(13) synthase TruD [Candidatus Loosdrechtia aerotolerans]